MKEDNVFQKLKKHNGTLHLVGENFWMDLLENTFDKIEAIKSLDLHNYVSVEKKINESIFKLIEEDNFDVIVGTTTTITIII